MTMLGLLAPDGTELVPELPPLAPNRNKNAITVARYFFITLPSLNFTPRARRDYSKAIEKKAGHHICPLVLWRVCTVNSVPPFVIQIMRSGLLDTATSGTDPGALALRLFHAHWNRPIIESVWATRITLSRLTLEASLPTQDNSSVKWKEFGALPLIKGSTPLRSNRPGFSISAQTFRNSGVAPLG